MSRSGAVAVAAVVSGVLCFATGLAIGALLTKCHVHCLAREQKEVRTEKPPVYEDIRSDESKGGIELQQNEAYGQFS